MLGLEATVRELNSFPNCFMILFLFFWNFLFLIPNLI